MNTKSNDQLVFRHITYHLPPVCPLAQVAQIEVRYQTCSNLGQALQGTPKIRSPSPHFRILWAKVEFSHNVQWDRQMFRIQWPFEIEKLLYIPKMHNDKIYNIL